MTMLYEVLFVLLLWCALRWYFHPYRRIQPMMKRLDRIDAQQQREHWEHWERHATVHSARHPACNGVRCGRWCGIRSDV